MHTRSLKKSLPQRHQPQWWFDYRMKEPRTLWQRVFQQSLHDAAESSVMVLVWSNTLVSLTSCNEDTGPLLVQWVVAKSENSNMHAEAIDRAACAILSPGRTTNPVLPKEKTLWRLIQSLLPPCRSVRYVALAGLPKAARCVRDSLRTPVGDSLAPDCVSRLPPCSLPPTRDRGR